MPHQTLVNVPWVIGKTKERKLEKLTPVDSTGGTAVTVMSDASFGSRATQKSLMTTERVSSKAMRGQRSVRLTAEKPIIIFCRAVLPQTVAQSPKKTVRPINSVTSPMPQSM